MICNGPLQRRLLRGVFLHGYRPAVSSGRCRSVTHAGLLMNALRRSWRMEAYSDRLNSPVVLRFPKGTDLIEHIVSVILSGGRYLCVDPSWQVGGGLEALRVFDTKLVIHSPASLVTDKKEDFPEMVCLRPAYGWPSLRWWIHWTGADGNEPCALVQTSGTSAEPCGVIQTAEALLHHAEWTITSQKINQRSRLSWVASPGVAAAHSHLFAALLSGACLCPFEPAVEGLAAMTIWMRSERITHLHATPSLVRAWLDSLPDGSEFPDLQCVKLGGEPARRADARLLRRKLKGCPRLFNGLGMSEASGNITLCEITAGDLEGDGLLPVGKPVHGRGVSVESTPGCEAARGESGEIVVRDAWVSPGYQPAGAREAIRATAHAGIRELRTGDAGRWDEEDRLVHLGRLDRRIRVRGISVDLAEVEARIASLVGVRQVVAVAEANRAGFRVAIILVNDTAEARREMAQVVRRGSGMRPSRVAFFCEIPLKSNGKRDDAALLRDWPEEQAAMVLAGCEVYIREAWMRVLGHADFGYDDAFTDAGGDSLSAMNLAIELSRVTRREVGMVDLVRHPTVSQQAKALELLTLGNTPARLDNTRFQSDWVSIDTHQSRRLALMHAGGHSSESDVWVAGALMSELAGEVSLRVVRTNIEYPQTIAPERWEELIDPLVFEAAIAAKGCPRLLLVGVCVGAFVIADLAERLRAGGADEFDLVLLDPWTPGLQHNEDQAALHSVESRKYYALIKSRIYPEAIKPTCVILAGDDPQFEARRDYWVDRIEEPSRLHVVQGDHITFLREHRNKTTRALAASVRKYRK